MSIYEETNHSEDNIRDPFKKQSESGNPYQNLDPDPDKNTNRAELDAEEKQVREENMLDSDPEDLQAGE